MNLSNDEILELLAADDIDTGKYGLGKICKYGHEYKNTGMSLRRRIRFRLKTCNECLKIYAERHKIDYSNHEDPRTIKVKESAKKSRKKHLEKNTARVKEWRESNSVKLKEQRERYEEKNRARLREAKRNRYLKKKAENLAQQEQEKSA